MKLIKLKCDNCNATLEINSELNEIICNYCGNKILIDDEASRISRVEEAKLKARKNQHEQVLKEKREMDEYKEEKKKKKFKEELIPYIGICALFTCFSPLMQYIEEQYLATGNLVLTIISLILDLITFLIVKNVIKTKNKELNEVLPILLLIVAAVLGFIVMYSILSTYE